MHLGGCKGKQFRQQQCPPLQLASAALAGTGIDEHLVLTAFS